MRLLALTAAVFVLVASAASAHVTVIPASARPGEARTLTFRVLNERDDAQTVGVELFIPAGVTADPGARRGWTAVDKGGSVEWTADSPSDAIGGSTAKDFDLRVGPLPHAGRLVFKVLQRYSSGDVVRWIQDPSPGADRPAPVVELTATGRPSKPGGSSSATAGWALLAVLAAGAAAGAALILRRRRRR